VLRLNVAILPHCTCTAGIERAGRDDVSMIDSPSELEYTIKCIADQADVSFDKTLPRHWWFSMGALRSK
jgi:hypothetical protein